MRDKEAKEGVGLILLSGATVMMACSGTACRAPTEDTANANRTLRFSCAKHRDCAAFLRGQRHECLCYWKASAQAAAVWRPCVVADPAQGLEAAAEAARDLGREPGVRVVKASR